MDIDENVATAEKRDVQEIVAEIKDDGNADKSDNIEKLETHQIIHPKQIEVLKTFRYYILQTDTFCSTAGSSHFKNFQASFN